MGGAVLGAALLAGLSLALGGLPAAASGSRNTTTGVAVVSTSLLYGGSAAGTGVVLTSSGEVLTNNHVIRGAQAIRVTAGGRTYAATVTGYSISKDVALLQLRNAHGLQTALMGNSSTARVGDRVVAVGNAGGTGVLTTKSGRLTGLRQAITVSDEEGGSSRLTGLIETSAPLRPGDSGGPLLSHGRVIGIDAAASTRFQFQGQSGDGYAIPINSVLGIAKQIETGRRTSTVHVGPTAFLGVSLGVVGEGQPGAVVRAVVPGSPADKAGLGPDDVITSFGGHRVSSSNGLRNLVLRYAPGRTVRVTWFDQFAGTSGATVRLVSGPPQ
jgi:S1-C subfamily serine protease